MPPFFVLFWFNFVNLYTLHEEIFIYGCYLTRKSKRTGIVENLWGGKKSEMLKVNVREIVHFLTLKTRLIE